MLRIIVTGATGNVGTRVVERLCRSEQVGEVVALARHHAPALPDGVQFVAADVARDPLEPLFRGADAVIHLAWLLQPSRDERKLHRVNVEGTRRVLDAVVRAEVPHVVVASSVGAYSPGPKDHGVDESWPTDGIPTSLYSRQKVMNERMMDGFEREHPGLVLTRMRPGLIFQRRASSEIKRLFVGRLVPRWLFKPSLVPFVPALPRFRFQALHSSDVAEAFCRVVERKAGGAFNLAAGPVLDPSSLAETLHAKPLRIPAPVLRGLVSASFRLHLQPTDPGWIDIALQIPIMSTARAQRELDWAPSMTSTAALLELMEGIRDGAGTATFPLRPSRVT